MTELELRQLADTILAPLLVADDHGTVLAENRAWVSVRQMLGAQAAELRALCEKYRVPFVVNDSVEGERIDGGLLAVSLRVHHAADQRREPPAAS